jgi:hypothetical protein
VEGVRRKIIVRGPASTAKSLSPSRFLTSRDLGMATRLGMWHCIAYVVTAPSVARCKLRLFGHSAYGFMALIAVECVSTQMSPKVLFRCAGLRHAATVGCAPSATAVGSIRRSTPWGPVLRRLQ